MTFLAFLLLTSFGVWNGTERRLGTSDEWRTLAGVFAAIVIYAGTSVLLDL